MSKQLEDWQREILDAQLAQERFYASDAPITEMSPLDGWCAVSYDAGLQSIAGLMTAANQMIYTTAADAYATTALTPFARTILDDANAGAVLTTLGLRTVSTLNNVPIASGGTGATDVAAARTNLGLGTMATQNAAAVAITGGAIAGITDLAIADGGTGASTAAAARTNLGLGTMATENDNAVNIIGGTITGITDLAIADGGTGASTVAAAVANLGLGNVNNTSDANKPVSTAQQAAIDTAVTYVASRISPQSAGYTAVRADNAASFRFTAAATLALTAAATLGANWWCEVWATNGNVTIDPNGSQTIDGSLTMIVQTGQMAKVFCNGTAFFTEIVGDPLSGPQLQGYSFGLDLTNTAADLANDVDIAAGAAASDTSPFYLMQLTAARAKRIDAAWAVGNNAGGLDTGTVSSDATYYIWLIQRSDTLVTDALFSLSATAPTMPANYDRKRLIGSLVRTGSANGVPRSRLTTPPPVESAQLTPVLGARNLIFITDAATLN